MWNGMSLKPASTARMFPSSSMVKVLPMSTRWHKTKSARSPQAAICCMRPLVNFEHINALRWLMRTMRKKKREE